MKGGILVLSIDRDNDLGEKIGVEGPIFGRKANLDAANSLAIADPEDSDANCIFGAIREYDELNKADKKVNIATLTGDSRVGVVSDEKISEQLETVIDEYSPQKVVLVTDGLEDEFVMPIIQSKIPILSVKRVIVRQSLKFESDYYILLKFFKDLLSDVQTRRMAYGIPALVLIFYALVGSVAWRLVIGLVGVFMIIKGFQLEKFIASFAGEVGTSLSRGKLSFFLYTLCAVFFLIGFVQGYDAYTNSNSDSLVSWLRFIDAGLAPYLAMGLCFITARLLYSKEKEKRNPTLGLSSKANNRFFRYITYYALAFSLYIVLSSTIAYLTFDSTLVRLIFAIVASFMILFMALITERTAFNG